VVGRKILIVSAAVLSSFLWLCLLGSAARADDDGNDMGIEFTYADLIGFGPTAPGPPLPATGQANTVPPTPRPNTTPSVAEFGPIIYYDGPLFGVGGALLSGVNALASSHATGFIVPFEAEMHYHWSALEPSLGVDMLVAKAVGTGGYTSSPFAVDLNARAGARYFLSPSATVGGFVERTVTGNAPMWVVGVSVGWHASDDD
jgi:hypothetical protein